MRFSKRTFGSFRDFLLVKRRGVDRDQRGRHLIKICIPGANRMVFPSNRNYTHWTMKYEIQKIKMRKCQKIPEICGETEIEKMNPVDPISTDR